jgi:hypothetical protein
MSQAELCERHAKECLQAAGQSEDPLTREILAGAAERDAAPELSLTGFVQHLR